MDLHPVSHLDPARLRALREAVEDVRRADAPWWHPETDRTIERQLRCGWEGDPGRWFLIGEDPLRPDGYLVVHTSAWDNPELAWLWLGIVPARRREGRGRAAAELAFDVCRDLGRTLIGIDGWDGAAARGFAAATGFELKSVSACRRLRLAGLEPGLVERRATEAASSSAGYELVRVPGSVPDELLGPIASLTEAINDAPLDDLEVEDEVFPPARIRAYEQAQAAGGWTLRRLVARHRVTGELAGHTVVAVDRHRPIVGEQHDTAVARAHRGHRLGLRLKADMLRWLAEEEPQLETVDTWNAESNTHMVAVNEALGHDVMGRNLEFQRRI